MRPGFSYSTNWDFIYIIPFIIFFSIDFPFYFPLNFNFSTIPTQNIQNVYSIPGFNSFTFINPITFYPKYYVLETIIVLNEGIISLKNKTAFSCLIQNFNLNYKHLEKFQIRNEMCSVIVIYLIKNTGTFHFFKLSINNDLFKKILRLFYLTI